MGSRQLLLIPALAIALGLAACGGSSRPKILDTERIERAIEQSVLQKRHLHAQVSCPAGIEQKKGVVFRCTAVYKSGQNPFVVTQDDSRGAVHWVGVSK